MLRHDTDDVFDGTGAVVEFIWREVLDDYWIGLCSRRSLTEKLLSKETFNFKSRPSLMGEGVRVAMVTSRRIEKGRGSRAQSNVEFAGSSWLGALANLSSPGPNVRYHTLKCKALNMCCFSLLYACNR